MLMSSRKRYATPWSDPHGLQIDTASRTTRRSLNACRRPRKNSPLNCAPHFEQRPDRVSISAPLANFQGSCESSVFPSRDHASAGLGRGKARAWRCSKKSQRQKNNFDEHICAKNTRARFVRHAAIIPRVSLEQPPRALFSSKRTKTPHLAAFLSFFLGLAELAPVSQGSRRSSWNRARRLAAAFCFQHCPQLDAFDARH